MDPWPHSEAGRFHRGISLALVAGLLLAAGMARNHAPLELAVLGTALAATGMVARHMLKAFRASPANFPAPQPAPPPPTKTLDAVYRKGKEEKR